MQPGLPFIYQLFRANLIIIAGLINYAQVAQAHCKLSSTDNLACFCILSLVILGTRKALFARNLNSGMGKFMFSNLFKNDICTAMHCQV